MKLVMLKLNSNVLEEIKGGQKFDQGLIDRLVLINQGKEVNFRVDENGIRKFWDQVCVPDFSQLEKRILKEGQMSSLRIYLGATKMQQDMKKMFWCPGMTKDVVEFVYYCFTCQKSKIEHHKLS